MPIDYSRGKIYKIIDNSNGNIYIGSTCEPILARRLANHVRNYKCYKKETYNYVTSFKILENDDYDIILLELFPCNSKDELHAREKHFIQATECVNKYIPCRSPAEYYIDNKEKLNEKHKQYYENNKEKLNEKIICNCSGQYTKTHKERHLRTLKHKKWQDNNN